MTLNADCATDTPIVVPNGYTLDGNGHTITAVDRPRGAFNGAVVENDGAAMNVKNLKIDGDSTARTTASPSSTASPSCTRAGRSRTSR